MRYRGHRDENNINGRGYGAIKEQINDDTDSILTGEYVVSEDPSLILEPPGVDCHRHVECNTDLSSSTACSAMVGSPGS